jgi:RimJ/RimL family protein N-acetyltransferase
VKIPTLETQWLRLRGWRDDDLDALAAIKADPEAMLYIDEGRPLTRAECVALLAQYGSEWEEHGFGRWAVEERSSGLLIGDCGLLPYGPEGGELAYMIARSHWGKGYGTEAARAALDYGFTKLDLKRIVAVTQTGNHASQRVLEKVGMRHDHDVLAARGTRNRLYALTALERRLGRGV